MSHQIAVIGDHFMDPDVFVRAINSRVTNAPSFRTMKLPFPDQSVTQRSDSPELSRIREFQGKPDEIVNFISSAEMMITHVAPLTQSMLDQLPGLKFVGVSRGGPVNVDREALCRRGVRLVNTPGRNASAVAEFTVGALIAETRNIIAGHTGMKAQHWRGDLYRADIQRKELSAMTVGIVGYSHIGKRVGQLLKAFASRILVCDPYIELDSDDLEYGIKRVELDELLSLSDAVTLHVPSTPDTTGMLSRERLAGMKPGAVLVNTARGSLVDEEALADSLANGHLSGAVLDTYQIEPVPASSPLRLLDNVLLTPHIAGASLTTVTVAADMIAEEVLRYVNGQDPINGCCE